MHLFLIGKAVAMLLSVNKRDVYAYMCVRDSVLLSRQHTDNSTLLPRIHAEHVYSPSIKCSAMGGGGQEKYGGKTFCASNGRGHYKITITSGFYSSYN